MYSPFSASPQSPLHLLAFSLEEKLALSLAHPLLRKDFQYRRDLNGQIDEFYTLLQETFPDNVMWDGDHFECTDWDSGSYVLNYYRSTGEFEYTPEMFTKDDARALEEALSTVSSSSPAHMALFIPVVQIKVPFLDITRVSYWNFQTNSFR